MSASDSLVLAVDTSSAVVSAALVDVAGDAPDVLAARDLTAPNRHGELLAAAVAELFDEAHLSPSSIAAVAAGLGPGPFTGLRVGVVTAASLADALGRPAYGVCSLDAVAWTHRDGAPFLVCTDARRKQVYWACYDAGGRREQGPDIGFPDDVAARFAGDVSAVFGAGCRLYPEAFAGFAQRVDASPSATHVAELVAARVRAGSPGERLEPMYLRRPDATPPGRPKPVLPV